MGGDVMSEGIFTLELGRYGLMLDTEWAYVSISWELITLSVVGAIVYKVIKRKKNK
jgi:hypothetical protein